MGLADVKKELKQIEKDKLIEMMLELYKKNKSVKEFLDFYANPNEKELHEKYRKKVYEAFYPQRGYKLRLKEGKQAISDFKKLGPSTDLLADLMLFYVETGVEFTNDYGDIDERFYSSLESTYEAALKLMQNEDMLDKFKERAEKVVDDTSHIGWGFHDYLYSTFFDYYYPIDEH